MAVDCTAEDCTAEDGMAEDGRAEVFRKGWTVRRYHMKLTIQIVWRGGAELDNVSMMNEGK